MFKVLSVKVGWVRSWGWGGAGW